jgi:hypothetical protein
MEQGDGLRPGQHVDLHPTADRAPAGIAGSNEHVPGSAGPVVGDVRRPLGVVEDQQPAGPVAQLGQQPVHGLGHRGPRWEVKPGGEGGQLFGDEYRLCGVDPPDQLVVGGEAVGVLDRQLGLAHPT